MRRIIILGMAASLLLAVHVSAVTIGIQGTGSSGPIDPGYASSIAWNGGDDGIGYPDNVIEGLRTDTSPVGSGREQYKNVDTITPPDLMTTTKFEAFGPNVFVSGEHGKQHYNHFRVTTGENTQVALQDISWTLTATGADGTQNVFGLNGSGSLSGLDYNKLFQGTKADGTILNDGEDGSTLVSIIDGIGRAKRLPLEDLLPNASGPAEEQWEDLWMDINGTIMDVGGEVEFVRRWEIGNPGGPGVLGSIEHSTTLKPSNPDVAVVPAPSAASAMLVPMGFALLFHRRRLRQRHTA